MSKLRKQVKVFADGNVDRRSENGSYVAPKLPDPYDRRYGIRSDPTPNPRRERMHDLPQDPGTISDREWREDVYTSDWRENDPQIRSWYRDHFKRNMAKRARDFNDQFVMDENGNQIILPGLKDYKGRWFRSGFRPGIDKGPNEYAPELVDWLNKREAKHVPKVARFRESVAQQKRARALAAAVGEDTLDGDCSVCAPELDYRIDNWAIPKAIEQNLEREKTRRGGEVWGLKLLWKDIKSTLPRPHRLSKKEKSIVFGNVEKQQRATEARDLKRKTSAAWRVDEQLMHDAVEDHRAEQRLWLQKEQKRKLAEGKEMKAEKKEREKQEKARKEQVEEEARIAKLRRDGLYKSLRAEDYAEKRKKEQSRWRQADLFAQTRP